MRSYDKTTVPPSVREDSDYKQKKKAWQDI